MIKEPELTTTPLREVYRQQALTRLEAYLNAVPQDRLRGHQVETLVALRDFIASGQTAGYISLPTGSGKTYLISELAQVIGLKTVSLSPTKTILEHTHGVTRSLTPDTEITNYYSRNKDSTGQVINTTYQSLPTLLEKGLLNPEEIGLLICDEAHLALGEQRHKIYQKIPHALMIGLTATPYFGHLEGYRRRGIVGNERWTEIFTNQIHEMSLEEGMERGILAPLDVHLVKTTTSVDNVDISQGDYSKAQLERLLNIEARNWLTIALIAGVDKLPDYIKISEDKRAEINMIHQKIKDKNGIAIFGLSIEHIEKLTQMLRDSDVLSAFALHSKMSDDTRTNILEKYEEGDIKVILGVDMLSVGWDSPRTQVGIYLAPTQSGIVAVQQLGRILRPYPEISKDQAIAIQLVDEFKKASQAPILIPNLFDPEYVLSGTARGDEPSGGTKTSQPAKPLITFSGLGIDSIIEQTRSQQLLKTRFKTANLQQMNDLFNNLVEQVSRENPGIGSYELFKTVLTQLPEKIPTQTQQLVLQGLASIDTNAKAWAKKALLLLGLRQTINGVDFFTLENTSEREKDEMVHTGLSAVMEQLSSLKPNQHLSYQLYYLVRDVLAKYIASRDQTPIAVIQHPKYRLIETTVQALGQRRKTLTQAEVESLAQELALETDLPYDEIKNYLTFRAQLTYFSQPDEEEMIDESNTSQQAENESLRETVDEVLDFLSAQQRNVIRLRFGLVSYYGRGMTLEEAGRELRVSAETIRQMEARAIRNLRRPSSSKHLKDFVDEEETEGIIAFSPEIEERFGRVFGTAEKQVVRRVEPIFEVEKMDFTPEQKQVLTRLGIRQIGDLFANGILTIARITPEERQTVFPVLRDVLRGFRLMSDEGHSWLPPSDPALLNHIADTILKKNSQFIFRNLKGINQSNIEEIRKSVKLQQIIFAKAFDSLFYYLS